MKKRIAFAVGIFFLSFVEQTQADQYLYAENPNPAIYEIQQYEGPLPNQSDARVSCWIIHNGGHAVSFLIKRKYNQSTACDWSSSHERGSGECTFEKGENTVWVSAESTFPYQSHLCG